MSADPAHQLGLAQQGDPQAAVPVASTEQQPAITGHHEDLGADPNPRSERSAEEALSSVAHREENSWISLQSGRNLFISTI